MKIYLKNLFQFLDEDLFVKGYNTNARSMCVRKWSFNNSNYFVFYSIVIFRTYQTDIEEAIKSCASLLDEPDLEIAVRVGDVYAFLINHFTSSQDYQQVCFPFRTSTRIRFFSYSHI